MATPVRIKEGNYADLQQEADREHRSVVQQLNYILEQRYDVSKTTPPAKNTNTPNLQDTVPITHTFETGEDAITPEKNIVGATPEVSTRVDDLFATPPSLMTEEMPCCQNDTQPCRHWTWDARTGEGYRNSLSGRFMEVD